MKKAILLVVVILLVFVWIKLRHSARRNPGSAKMAADFSLADISGRTLRLSDYRGKVVVLDFWATWCDPCKEEIPHFIALQEKYPQQLQLIGLSMDDDEKPVRVFQQQYKMNYPIALATPEIAGRYGGILGLPVTFVIDRSGHIAARHIGATKASVIEAEVEKLVSQPLSQFDATPISPPEQRGTSALLCCYPLTTVSTMFVGL